MELDMLKEKLWAFFLLLQFITKGFSANEPKVADEETPGDYVGGEMNCPPLGQEMLYNPVPWGAPYRAYLTLPKGLRIAPSSIPGAGLGVFADTFIKKYTWLGEYEGEYIPVQYGKHISNYAWTINRASEMIGFIDAYTDETSSYLRFINSAMKHKRINVNGLECYTKIFFVAISDIHPGEELFTDYGLNFRLHFKFDLNDFYDVHLEWRLMGLDLNNATHRALLTSYRVPYETMNIPEQ